MTYVRWIRLTFFFNLSRNTMSKQLPHKFNVTLLAANAVRIFSERPTKMDNDLRAFGEEIVMASQVAYAGSDGLHLVTGPSVFTIQATQVSVKGDLLLIVHVDGTKATFNTKSQGLEVNISELNPSEGDDPEEEDEDEEDEEEEEIPVKRGAKKAVPAKKGKPAPVEEEDDEEEEEEDDEEEDEIAPPKRASAKKAVPAKKGKPAPVEEEDDEEEEEEDDEEEEEEIPVKRGAKKAVPAKKGKPAPVEEEDEEEDEDEDEDEEEEEIPVKRGAKKAVPAKKGKKDDDEFADWA